LREVLKDVAEMIPEGQYANMWTLKEGWKVGLKGEPLGEEDGKMEVDGDDGEGKEEEFEDDDEDDADLEEVLML